MMESVMVTMSRNEKKGNSLGSKLIHAFVKNLGWVRSGVMREFLPNTNKEDDD